MKKIIICVFVLCSLVISLCACGKHSQFDSPYKIWEASEDGYTITDGESTYHRYGELPLGVRVENNSYRYYNEVVIDGYSYDIYSSDENSDILYVYEYHFGITAYVKEGNDGSNLDAFISGGAERARMIDYYNYLSADIDTAFIESLDALSDDVMNVAVRKLAPLKCYDIVFSNENDSLAYSHGAIYRYNGDLYYINYDRLSNNYFDSFGDFSYGRGTVDMYKLTDDLRAQLDRYETMLDDYHDDYEIETPNVSENTPEDAIRTIVAVCVFFGIIIPLIPLAIAVISIVRKRSKADLYTYVLLFSSVLWIISGIVILIFSL